MRNFVLWIVGIILFLLLILLIWYLLRNRPPVANEDSFSANSGEVVAGSVTANDSDPDGDALTVTTPQVSGPISGTLQLDPTGMFTYTPNPGVTGADQFRYEVCDPGGKCAQANVMITINVPPVVANDDTAQTMMNTAVPINVLANDQGAIVTVATTDAAAAVQADNSIVYTPAISVTGVISFTYNACNASAVCDSANVAVTVWDFQLVDDHYQTPKNTAVSNNVRKNDLGNPTITTTPVVSPTKGTVTIQPDGQFTYTPNTDVRGEDTFTYQGCNAAGGCGQAIVTIIVGGPTTNPDTYTTSKNTPVSNNVLANDDGHGLTITATLVTMPVSGTVTLASDGAFTYTPNTDITGTDTFTYKACDTDNICVKESVTITVTSIPETAHHTVVYGEWLLQIARCYGTTVQAIRMHNYIPYPDLIYPGQVLYITGIGTAGPYQGPPCVQYHTVAAGETLASIAQMYGITESELARVNGMYTYYYGYGYYGYGYFHYHYYYKTIYVGQKLIVPRPIPDYMQPKP